MFSYETFVRLSQNCSAAFPLCRRNVDNQASLYLTVTALHVIHKSEENMYNLTYELEMFEECKTGHTLGLNSNWSLLLRSVFKLLKLGRIDSHIFRWPTVQHHLCSATATEFSLWDLGEHLSCNSAPVRFGSSCPQLLEIWILDQGVSPQLMDFYPPLSFNGYPRVANALIKGGGGRWPKSRSLISFQPVVPPSCSRRFFPVQGLCILCHCHC